MTIRAYDILRKNALGAPSWVEAVSDPQQAKARIAELAKQDPGEYIIFSQNTQQVIATTKGERRKP